MTLTNGSVDLRTLSSSLKSAQPRAKRSGAVKFFEDAAADVDGLQGLSFYDFFVGMNNLGARNLSKGKHILFALFRQLLWAVSSVFEKKVTSLTPVHTVRGVKREASRTYSDLPDTTVQRYNIYNPNNHRYTERELGRYVMASERGFRLSQHVALAGPDSTKVGTDLGLTMAAALNPVTRKVALRYHRFPLPVSSLIQRTLP